MSLSTELREQRAKLASEARTIVDRAEGEKRAMLAEENESWDKIMVDVDLLKGRIDKIEKTEALDSELKEVRNAGPGRESRIPSVTQTASLSDRQSAAWRSYLSRGEKGLAMHELQELRAIGATGTGVAGGYFAPAQPTTQFTEFLKSYTGVRQAPVKTVTTNYGNDIPWPTLDDTGRTGEQTAEGIALHDDQDPDFGQLIIKSYMFDSNILIVSKQFLQDSVIPADVFINESLAKRIGKKQNGAFTTGTGSGQCQGIVTGAGNSGVTMPNGSFGSSAAATVANFQDLIHSIDPAYRQGKSVGFMMHDHSVGTLLKLTDTLGRPLWAPGIAAGEPDRLFNYPYYINQDMSQVGSGTKSVLFGNFDYFLVRDVNSLEVIRLDERYAEKLQVGFMGYLRSDSKMLNSQAIKYALNDAS